MINFSNRVTTLPPEQEAIQNKCLHPTGSFVEFKQQEIEQSIPERFEKIAREYPDRVAVRTVNHTLSYDELNWLSSSVARVISSRCGNDNEPIALLLENDAPMIAAIIGTLKAGKIYVPLDPLLPGERATFVLKDSSAALIVTDNKNIDLAIKWTNNALPLINIDTLDASPSSDSVGLSISPDALTWILYTSGSTGQPKGVVQSHRNVLHYVMNYTNNLRISADDRFILVFRFSVNGAAHEIFTALLNGAAVYPLNIKEVGLNCMADWLLKNEISICSCVPTVFRHFVKTLTGKEEFPHLRLIKMIGEPVSKREVNLYKNHFSDACIFINRLGSTETGSIRWYFIDKNTQVVGSAVPVGYPVAGNEILLLDDSGKEVGFNKIGEIAVKSRFLTPGYWRKPDLTQAIFLTNRVETGERIYLTGDMGRMMPDGCLEYIERKDFQVKIRGHRIEIAEVEMALLALDKIREAVIVARADTLGEQRLVAYLIPERNSPPTVTELRTFLSNKLPDYMIPSAWVFLDTLPLAPNGKVDRRALPAPSAAMLERNAPSASPQTPIEETLAGIWSEVLGVSEVGVQEKFLELGGNSLLASQPISQVTRKFQVELNVPSLFQAPTVAEMALVIAQKQAMKVGQQEVSRLLSELDSLSEKDAQGLIERETRKKRYDSPV